MQIFKLNEITIHSFSIEELEKSLLDNLSSDQVPQIITTFNIDFLRIAEKNRDFLHICKNSLWNLPDGIGITSLIRLKYKKKIERITGNEIFPILMKIANHYNYRVALIGSSQEVLDIVSAKIKKSFSEAIENLLCISPQFLFEENKIINQDIINKIIAFKPSIVFAALGCPRQEIWLSKNMQKFGSKINIGIGAVLDYHSGIKKRSPDLFQRFGFEWLWRLFNEPGRLFKRYIIYDLSFYLINILKVIKSRFLKNSN